MAKKMYYKLKERFGIESFSDGVTIIVDRDTGFYQYISNLDSTALSLANGIISSENPMMRANMLRRLEFYREKGIVEALPAPERQPQMNIRHFDNYHIASAFWSITGRCNYRCRHCFISAPHEKHEMTHEECLGIIDQLASCGIHGISITGGEPLVRKDFFSLLDAFKEKGIYVTEIYSNGRLVNEALLDKLDSLGFKCIFDVSYDGTEGWHNWIRGVDNAEEDVIRAIKLAVSRGFPVTAETCVHKKNLHTLRDSMKLLGDLGVSSVKVNVVNRSGEWTNEPQDYDISLDEAMAAALEYIPDYYKDGAPLDIALFGVFYGVKHSAAFGFPFYKYNNDVDPDKVYICGHAKSEVYIAHDGIVMPCMPIAANERLKAGLPNILEMPLKDILADSSYRKLTNMTLSEYFEHNPECAECEDRFHCGAGCRGDAMTLSDDYFAKDGTKCFIYKNGYPKKIAECAKEASRVLQAQG